MKCGIQLRFIPIMQTPQLLYPWIIYYSHIQRKIKLKTSNVLKFHISHSDLGVRLLLCGTTTRGTINTQLS